MHGEPACNKRANGTNPRIFNESALPAGGHRRWPVVDSVSPHAYLSGVSRLIVGPRRRVDALMLSSLTELLKRMLNISSLAKRFFGSANDRFIKGLQKAVQQINALEPELEKLPDDQLRARTDWLKE